MGLSPGRRVTLQPGPFGWPGALVVGTIVLVGAWAFTGSPWQATVGGVTATLTWYVLHRLAERFTPQPRRSNRKNRS